MFGANQYFEGLGRVDPFSIVKDICVDTYIAFLERLASLLVLVTKVLLGSFCKEVTNVEKDEGIQDNFTLIVCRVLATERSFTENEFSS